MEDFESTVKMCVACRQAPAHPTYDGYCEGCFVDKKFLRAYGTKPKDRSIRNTPNSVSGHDDIGFDGGRESLI